MDIDISCPTCGRDDWVQSVPAIRATGIQTVYGTDHYTGVGIASSGLVPVFGSATIERTHTSQLAQALAPEPHQRPTGRLVLFSLIMAIPLLVTALAVVAAFGEPNRDVSWPWLALSAAFVLAGMCAPSALALGVAIKRVRRGSRIARGRPAAYAVWHAGQYCHRCGVCFVPHTQIPDVLARQPLAPSQFRWAVWNAGGYANL